MKEQLKGGRVKGGIPRAHLAWVKQQGGEKAVEDVAGQLVVRSRVPVIVHGVRH